jgi:hypothetical protein
MVMVAADLARFEETRRQRRAEPAAPEDLRRAA